MIRQQKLLMLAAAAVLLVLVILVGVLQHYGGQKAPAPKPMVGFFLQGGLADKGWNHNNFKGAQDAAMLLGIQLDSRANLLAGSEGARQGLKESAQKGEKFVFLASSDYEKDLQWAQQQGLRQIFAIPALEMPANEHVIPYFIRLYQGEYLAGVLAGARSRSDKIGYVASTPVPEVVRCIDAFTLGVRKSNPHAVVVVYWIGSWDDADKENAAVGKLVQAGVDVLNSHQDRPHVQQAAAHMRVDFISYQELMEADDPHNLATVVCDWSVLYRRMMQDYQQGQLRSSYWLGFPEKAIDLNHLSPQLTAQERGAVAEAKQNIQSGWNIFSGEIRDLKGRIRCAEDESITDDTLIRMDWYVEGVMFYE